MCCKGVDRLPSKIFVRTSHFALTLGVIATLVFQKTELQAAIEDGNFLYCLCFLTLMVFSLIMYLVASVMDPGYVPIIDKKPAWQRDSDSDEDSSDHDDILYDKTQLRQVTNVNGNVDNLNRRSNDTLNMMSNDGEHTEICLDDSDSENTADERSKMITQTSPSRTKKRKCGFCGIHQPLRARHCEDCGRCVLKFDHHCPWLETCVGESNHKYFWLFLLSTLALIVWCGHIAGDAYVFRLEWNDWVHTNALFVLDIAIVLVGGLVVLILTGLHTYLACTNQSTWELVSRHRITYLKHIDSDANPFHEGYICNAWRFLCYCRKRHWDIVYNKIAPTLQHDEESQL